jgi:hypothetical protein
MNRLFSRLLRLFRIAGKAVVSRAGRNGSTRQARRNGRYGSNDLDNAFPQLLDGQNNTNK